MDSNRREESYRKSEINDLRGKIQCKRRSPTHQFGLAPPTLYSPPLHPLSTYLNSHPTPTTPHPTPQKPKPEKRNNPSRSHLFSHTPQLTIFTHAWYVFPYTLHTESRRLTSSQIRTSRPASPSISPHDSVIGGHYPPQNPRLLTMCAHLPIYLALSCSSAR